ncbi:magnesium transporter [Clostridium magnum]|uniref:Magnesium transporter MgtE n=1 Tax=Clostridium magnum DSM 2767 TaxID=1121326 RepID=A0A161WJ55_9CLOT|nr:CBS domain-containing protein [Clostridium magnum]KZL91745.1 magnesium transporter MgtE [Clostridium magnum DSM 2767]SHJ03348.1 CBS domain-containing protein [Clostridium magnum DSM 2767]
MQLRSVYLSRILSNKIYNDNKEVVGTLKDLAVDINFKNPKITIAVVKTKEGVKFIDFDNINVSKEKGQYVLVCNKVEEKDLGDYMLLKKYVLDKQIIDVNGRKVVRANDVRLVILSSGMFIAAVDIGMDGVLRRIGIAKPLKKLGLKVSSKLMLWDDVQTAFASKDIFLSKTYNKLHTLHPSDLADIIEDFDVNTGAIIFSTLDTAKAADVLEELEEDVQINLLRTLSTDKAADILEEMPADEAADVLDGLNENKAEELLNNMEKEASDEIRELMDYEEYLVGSIMNTDFISCPADSTVADAINDIRQSTEEVDQVYYVYVVSDTHKLKGAVSLRDLIIAEDDKKLEDVMTKEVIYMKDTDEISELVRDVSKYNLFAMPVVDEQMHLIGIVSVNDIVHELTKYNKRYR